MAKIEMIFTSEEIIKEIPYQFICQTRYSSIWDTMRRKVLWNNVFTEEEKEQVERMFRQTYTWCTKGITDTVRMDFYTYLLWDKIRKFCFGF